MGLFSKERADQAPLPVDPSKQDNGNISFGSDEDYRDKSESRVALNSQKLKANYGINDAIKLLSKLSHIDDDVKIVVAKTTLESMNVVITDIISDASSKEEKISTHVAKLNDEISDLEADIKQRKDQISALEKDLSETRGVRECLQKGEPKSKPVAKKELKPESGDTKQAAESKPKSSDH